MNKKNIDIINDCNDLNLEINDEILVINFFCDNQNNININIIQKNNSKLVINYSSIIKNNCTCNININVIGNNNSTIINNHVYAIENKSTFNVSVKANKGTKDNIIVEDLKGICENGIITYMPILEVDTNNVDASHYVTVGTFNEEELFYLKSKGINEEDCINLLKNNFIYNLFSKDFKEKIERSNHE